MLTPYELLLSLAFSSNRNMFPNKCMIGKPQNNTTILFHSYICDTLDAGGLYRLLLYVVMIVPVSYIPSKRETLTQCWLNVGPAS